MEFPVRLDGVTRGAVQFGKQLFPELHLVELCNETIFLRGTNTRMFIGTLSKNITFKRLFGKARPTPADVIVLSALLIKKKKGEGMLAGSKRYGSLFRNPPVDAIVINDQPVAHIETRTIVGIGRKFIFIRLVNEQETGVSHAKVILQSCNGR